MCPLRLTHGQAWLDLDEIGAMITGAQLICDGTPVRPFFQNPWRDDPRPMDTLTRHLGGEWPCVPFGGTQPPAGLPRDWKAEGDAAPWHQHAHGFGAHSKWTLTRQDAHTATAAIAYPTTSPITRLTRHVSLISETEIALSLTIEARAPITLPVGLHPVLSLADAAPGTAQLRVAGAQTAWTFPQDVEPGASHLKPDQRAGALAALVTAQGSQIDARQLPFAGHSEDLILLPAPAGRVSLARPDLGHRIDVSWDDQALPSCLLWLSNRGRAYAPWDSRVCAIGIEPIAAAFDLGVAHSTSPKSPLAQHGIRTAIDLRTDETWDTSYTISVHSEPKP